MAYRRIHCYAASFGHDLARKLIEEHGNPNGVVLDPFVGSGTTLLEALSTGHYAIGIDVDPIACLITRVQTRTYKLEELVSFESQTLEKLDRLEEELDNNTPIEAVNNSSRMFEIDGLEAQIPERSEIEFWFSDTQQVTLATLVAYMHTIEDARLRDIFAVSISSSIVRKWPNTLSLAMDIDHSRPHRANPERTTITQHFELFRRVFGITIKVLSELVNNTTDWLDEGTIVQGNCSEEMLSMKASSVDLVLTSPPYVNAIDYPRSHKFSEWWLSPDSCSCARANYIGLRGIGQETKLVEQAHQLAPETMQGMAWLKDKEFRAKASKIYKYIHDMNAVAESCAHVLRVDGKLVFVLADNRVNGHIIPVVNIVMEILRRKGFQEVHSYERKIKTSRRRYPFGFKGVMKKEAVITARK